MCGTIDYGAVAQMVGRIGFVVAVVGGVYIAKIVYASIEKLKHRHKTPMLVSSFVQK